MKLEELTPDLNISLIATINGEQLTFETKILEVYPKKKMVLAQPVMRNEKVVSFHVKNLMLSMIVNFEGAQPVMFKNITAGLVKKQDGELVYSLTTPLEGKAINRRGSYRCFVGSNIQLQLGLNHKTCDAVLRDVSSTGFAIVCDGDVELKENQVVHLVFQDRIEELAKNFNFQLYGIIVRIEELERGRMLYGCRLNTQVPGLDNYISIKQRIQLRNSSGNNL